MTLVFFIAVAWLACLYVSYPVLIWLWAKVRRFPYTSAQQLFPQLLRADGCAQSRERCWLQNEREVGVRLSQRFVGEGCATTVEASAPQAPHVVRRRVLHVEAGPTYGGSLHALQLYLANVTSGEFTHDVLLYSATPGYEQLRPLVKNLWILHPHASQGRTDKSGRRLQRVRRLIKEFFPSMFLVRLWMWITILRSLPTCWRLFRFFRREKYALVHVNNTFGYQPATVLAARIARIPLVCHVRNPQPRTMASRLLMRMGTYIVTVNKCHADALRAWNVQRPIITCYDPVKVPAADKQRAAQVRSSLLDGGDTLVGSVGRLDAQKGYEDLIHAARIVVDAQPRVRFAIAGEGDLYHSLAGLIERLHLEGSVVLCGFFPGNIADFLTALDLFVSSSHREGLPAVIVEAMLLQIPVLATAVDGNAEVVIPGRTGTLVPARNPAALAAALIPALQQLSSLKQQAIEAQKSALAQFDPQGNARAFDEIMSAVVSRRAHLVL